MTSDAEEYAKNRFSQLVKDRYYISKYCNTSYNDAGKLTPTEREFILSIITDELKAQQEARESYMSKE